MPTDSASWYLQQALITNFDWNSTLYFSKTWVLGHYLYICDKLFSKHFFRMNHSNANKFAFKFRKGFIPTKAQQSKPQKNLQLKTKPKTTNKTLKQLEKLKKKKTQTRQILVAFTHTYSALYFASSSFLASLLWFSTKLSKKLASS